MNDTKKSPKDIDEEVTIRLLGKFKATGVRRSPRVGDYYMCEHVMGVALCAKAGGTPKHILEKVNE